MPPANEKPQSPLHKDFYLCHPDPSLQCEDYCWGNLEAAHPVLGARPPEEVEEYRRSHGIELAVLRGERVPPKPFQAFNETSFPDFVEELAYELFTTDAVPFPVQAQTWPCVLSGSDTIAIAPTGSGKTLAFLLPALVHIMAQEPLEQGDGPIALMLAPTRELAQQTLAVAKRFCERTSGEDTLRVNAIFGGVDPSLQVPTAGAPDHGRWPELLVATPGRLVELLLKRRWMSSRRFSYVVMDEADQLLSPTGWLPQVRQALSVIRPERQLIMTSATWSDDAQETAMQICGRDVMRVRVMPQVPPIPQELRLFPGLDGDASQSARLEALDRWLRSELKQDESALVFCSSRHTARDLLAVAGTAGCSVAQLDGSTEERRRAYWTFVRGEVRVLVATFAVGSRGLDYANTVAAFDDAAPLSLAVVLFDFPPTIGAYAHCIGRTQRPGQKAGRAVAFIPEMRFWIARELRKLLETCQQPVPRELVELIDEDQRFMDDCRAAMEMMKAGQAPILPGEDAAGELAVSLGEGMAPAACGGDFSAARGVWRLPAAMPSYRRKLLHWLADELGLPHVSFGEAPGRRLHVALRRSELPDKFFLEGEEVLVQRQGRGGGECRAVVVDPKIDRRYRTLRVRLQPTGEEVQVGADLATPCESGAIRV